MHVEDTVLDDVQRALSTLRAGIRRHYDRNVNRDLSRQQWQGLFRRNVTAVLRQLYQDALKELCRLVTTVDLENSDISTTELLRGLEGVVEELIEYALQKHRTSCAMSNFPDEHNPDQAYLFEVIRETGRDWSDFKAQVDTMLPEACRG
jgi:monoamine oxidase